MSTYKKESAKPGGGIHYITKGYKKLSSSKQRADNKARIHLEKIKWEKE